MITSTMSYQEAATEMRLDFEAVRRKSVHFAKSFRTLALRAKNFPLIHSYFYTTPGKNNCIVTFYCIDKKHIDDSGQGICFYWEGINGKTVASLIFGNGIDGAALVFTPHCLKRFRERFLKEQPMTESQFLIEFIHSKIRFISVPVNPSICPNEENLSTETVGKAAIVSTPGVFFGELSVDTTEIVMKTFLTYDMLYPEQQDCLAEAIESIRNNPHSDPLYRKARNIRDQITLLGIGGKIINKEKNR